MPASSGSLIKTQVKKIDGLSIRYAESEPRGVSAILLSMPIWSRSTCLALGTPNGATNSSDRPRWASSSRTPSKRSR